MTFTAQLTPQTDGTVLARCLEMDAVAYGATDAKALALLASGLVLLTGEGVSVRCGDQVITDHGQAVEAPAPDPKPTRPE